MNVSILVFPDIKIIQWTNTTPVNFASNTTVNITNLTTGQPWYFEIYGGYSGGAESGTISIDSYGYYDWQNRLNFSVRAQQNKSATSWVNNYSAVINGVLYTTPTFGEIITPILESSNSLVNITYAATGYRNVSYINVNTSIERHNGSLMNLFAITATDQYTLTNITNLTAEVNGSSYTSNNGILYTNLAWIDGIFNVTVGSPDGGRYYNRTYSNYNVSTNLNASIWRSVVNVVARNGITGATLSNFNATISAISNSTNNGSVTFYIAPGSYLANASAAGYIPGNASFNISALETKTVYIDMGFNMTARVYNERTDLPFNISKTNATIFNVYCANSSQQYTLNSNTINFTQSCAWTFMKMDMTFISSTYFRTRIPDASVRDFRWYMIDVTEDTAYQIILQLNDLTGQYGDGHVIVRSIINGTQREIIEQSWDVSGQVTLFLLANGVYNIAVVDNNGNERSIGDLIADAPGTKTITIPTFPYVPSSFLGRSVSWSWGDNATRPQLNYQDSERNTLNVTFYVQNDSYDYPLIYKSTSFNVSNLTATYTGSVNISYVACFNASHIELGQIHACHNYPQIVLSDDPFTGQRPADNSKFSSYFWLLAVIAIIIVLGKEPTVALTLATIILAVTKIIGWYGLSGDTKDWYVIAIIGFFAFMSYVVEELRK